MFNNQLNSMQDSELLTTTKLLATKERALTVSLIEHLQEIFRRRLFADLGYSSLYDYVRKELGYSDAESAVRVSSMRLIDEVPKLKESLAQGKISLTSLSKTASSMRRQDQLLKEKLSLQQKEEMVTKVLGKSTRETEQILKEIELTRYQEKNIVPPPATTDNQKIVVSSRVVKKIMELKKLKGNYSDSELLELLLDQELKRLAEESQTSSQKKDKSIDNEKDQFATSEKKQSRYIPKKVKEAVKVRAQNRCEFVCQATGKRCEEVHGLELDHCLPFGWFGSSEEDNLSLRCRSHNLRAGIKSYGINKMDPYINKQLRTGIS